MAARERLVNDVGKIEEAFDLVCHFFDVPELLEDQKEALRQFFSGKELYFSAPTGFGKSLIFQCIPLINDYLNDQAIDTTLAIVISPLQSLMLDQVEQLKKTGVSAAAVFEGQSEEILKGVEIGEFSLVYSSPESMLSTEKWRQILTSSEFRKRCEVVVIDEAHCVIHWGTADGESKVPFRAWYGNLMELKSLLSSVRLAVFTATASKTTKRKLFEILHLNPLTTCVIEKDPNKDNIRYAVKYLENDLSLQDTFHSLIEEVKNQSVETEGTLIFCRTRKQCSLIFRAFTAALGNAIYNGKTVPRNRMVEMYHAGTPDSVKDHILSNITSINGHIRILICTIAFGMGVNCQYITRIIHFGGSKCIESYIQECGRVGRKGQSSTCILYYNGLLMKYSGDDMKNYACSKLCRRKEISSVFPTSKNSFSVVGCKCCDICSVACQCGEKNCLRHLYEPTKSVTLPRSSKQRNVSKESKKLLAEKLESYRLSLLPADLENVKPVSFPTVFLKFGHSQINQVLENCHLLFSFTDIKKYVEIWRNVYANNVLVALHEVFKDFPLEVSNLKLTMDDEHEIIDTDWAEIRDDTSMAFDFDNSTLLENTNTTVDDMNTSHVPGDMNTSTLIESIAVESSSLMQCQFVVEAE